MSLGLVLQPDGKAVASGQSWALVVARFTTNGALDSGFGSSGWTSVDVGTGSDYGNAIELQSTGR